jgi:hypothetical protein
VGRTLLSAKSVTLHAVADEGPFDSAQGRSAPHRLFSGQRVAC